MSDPAAIAQSLLSATLLITCTATLAWLGLGAIQPTMRRSCWSLSGSNALMALAIISNVASASGAGFWASWLADAAAIASFGMLLLAVAQLAEHEGDKRPAGLIPALAALTLLVLPDTAYQAWHKVIAFGCLALLSGLMAWSALRAMRQKAGWALMTVIAAPLIFMAALMVARIVQILLNPPGALTLAAGSAFNLAWLWSSLLLCLTINATMAFLLLMRLIGAIQRLTMQDPLTDVLNRRALSQAIEREHLRAQRGTPYSLVVLDMDRFKSLNDTHGHAAGDAALKALVATLRSCIRDIDSLGRLGGEEFCVLLPNTELAGAFLVAERMRAHLQDCDFRWQDEPWPLSASFGVAQAGREDAHADAVLRRADHAMYQAKTQGRNLVQALEA